MQLWSRTHRRFGFSSLAALAATCLLGRGTGTTGTATRGAGAAARAVAPAAARIIRAEAISLLSCCCLPVHVATNSKSLDSGAFLSPGLKTLAAKRMQSNPDRADKHCTATEL